MNTKIQSHTIDSVVELQIDSRCIMPGSFSGGFLSTVLNQSSIS